MLMINAFPDFYKNNGQNDEHDELVKAVLGKKVTKQNMFLRINFLLTKYCGNIVIYLRQKARWHLII